MRRGGQATGGRRGEAAAALRSCRPAFAVVALFSAFINILMLTGSVYMLQVYDRVLPSRSVATLIGISAIVLAAYLLQGALDALRQRMLSRIGAEVDVLLVGRVFDVATTLPLRGARPGAALQPLRDLDALRTFLSSLGPTALFDMPFMPIFFAGCFILHPWLGWLAVGGGLVIVALMVLTERLGKGPAEASMRSGGARQALLDASRRNAEVLKAMGMRRELGEAFRLGNEQHLRNALAAGDAMGGIGAVSKVFRMVLQSAMLGLGGYLVIQNEMSGGSMIAASIMSGRALAPIEIAVANWKGFLAARQGFARLKEVLATVPVDGRRLSLPKPEKELAVEGLVMGLPALQKPILQDVSFALKAGEALAVMGPSASGKSSLARALTGVWTPLRGNVRLDGAVIGHWDGVELGRQVGYLPQDVELFDGTVAENIARFRKDMPEDAVIAAARAAGAHEMILRLANGYETRIGEGGAFLSAGQRQRVALARALHGDPFLVVLDEPNANLDQEGDAALARAVAGVRERGGIVIVITHRPAGLAAVDLVAILVEGQLRAFGPKDEVLAGPPPGAAPVPARGQKRGRAAPAGLQGGGMQGGMELPQQAIKGSRVWRGNVPT